MSNAHKTQLIKTHQAQVRRKPSAPICSVHPFSISVWAWGSWPAVPAEGWGAGVPTGVALLVCTLFWAPGGQGLTPRWHSNSLSNRHTLFYCVLLYCILQALYYYSVQSLSHVWLFVTTWTAARQASLSITNSQSLLKLMSIESVMPSNHLILCHPLLLPSIFPSIRVFSNELVLHIRWPKYWSFSFSISPSNEHSFQGLGPAVFGAMIQPTPVTLKSGFYTSTDPSAFIRLWNMHLFGFQYSHPGKTG